MGFVKWNPFGFLVKYNIYGIVYFIRLRFYIEQVFVFLTSNKHVAKCCKMLQNFHKTLYRKWVV